MQLRYTAVDGGQLLKKAAQEAMLTVLEKAKAGTSSPCALADVSNDYAHQWYPLIGRLKERSVPVKMDMHEMGGYLPFWAREFGKAEVRMVNLFIVPPPTGNFDLSNVVTVTGSDEVKWEETAKIEDCIVLRSSTTKQNLKVDKDWSTEIATELPEGYMIEKL